MSLVSANLCRSTNEHVTLSRSDSCAPTRVFDDHFFVQVNTAYAKDKESAARAVSMTKASAMVQEEMMAMLQVRSGQARTMI